MNTMPEDYVALDINVLGHLLDSNPMKASDVNKDGHVTRLLEWLVDNNVRVLVDSEVEIWGEYERGLGLALDKAAENADRILLGYFLERKHHRQVEVADDVLLHRITETVPVSRNADRYYVYVAFKAGRPLVTNDYKHIRNKRDALLEKTEGYRCGEQEDVLTSREAYDRLPPN